MISYCLACLRPRYSQMLIEDLIRKTSVPFEILVWLNVEDLEFEDFLRQKQTAGQPITIAGKTPENIGMTAFLRLFEASRFDMVAQMDDDVVCVSPHIAETAAEIFERFRDIGMLTSDVWQDEYTNGARPPMNCYRAINAQYGLYDGPIDGWFAVYRKSCLQVCRTFPPARYMYLGSQIKAVLSGKGIRGCLCTRMKVFHVVCPAYVDYFNMLDFEINKYAAVGRTDMVQWYSGARSSLPPRDELGRRVKGIQASLSGQTMQDPAKVYEAHLLNPACDISAHLPLLRFLARGNVLEIGVRSGISTAALLLGVQENGGHVYSIDTDPGCGSVYAGHANWTFICGHSRDNSERILGQSPPPDLLVIDGDHSYEMVLSDLEKYGTRVRAGGLILLHDADFLAPGHDGVRPALKEFIRLHKHSLKFFPGSYGLGIVEIS
jgi:predicted O-methyltransferase YrrM